MRRLFVSLVLSILLGMSGLAAATSCDSVKATAESSVKLPVVMYHGILNSVKGRYVVSERQFEDDLTAFEKAGYQTVFPYEIIAYVNGTGTLPEKPLLITFDDGHYNTMYYGLPVLRRHGAKALANVIGKFTENTTLSGDDSNPNYSHLTWGQIGELASSGHFEIGNHSFNMHNYRPRFGIGQKAGESDEDYRQALEADAGRLQQKLAEQGVKCNVFAYPFGKYSPLAGDILSQMGFKMTLTCNEGVSTITKGSVESLNFLKRINRDGAYATEEFLKKIENYQK